MFTVKCSKKSLKFYQSLPAKDRRIVLNHIERLRSYPEIAGDIECLTSSKHVQYFRMHIGRSYTVLYMVIPVISEIHVEDVMSIEQAHKRYGR
jgi:mRNA interferase RelE/StbE